MANGTTKFFHGKILNCKVYLLTVTYLSFPTNVAFDVSGNMYIVDTGDEVIRKVDTNGLTTTLASSLVNPNSLAVDPSGNIYFSEWGVNRIQKIDPIGTMTTLVSGGDNYIAGLALDSAGNLYMSDFYGAVLKMDTNGRITTVAGTSTQGYSGDGGPAIQAQLSGPVQIAIDRAGNLYIADSGNGRVRKVDSSGIITTVAGNGTLAVGVNGKPATQTSIYMVHPGEAYF